MDQFVGRLCWVGRLDAVWWVGARAFRDGGSLIGIDWL